MIGQRMAAPHGAKTDDKNLDGHFTAPDVMPRMMLPRKNGIKDHHRHDGEAERRDDGVPVGDELPDEDLRPSVTVFTSSAGARINGNHRSFQMGIIVKIATVARAGRINGSTRRKKIEYSERPSMRRHSSDPPTRPA